MAEAKHGQAGMQQANPDHHAQLAHQLVTPSEDEVPALVEALLKLPMDAHERRALVFTGVASLMGRGAWMAAACLLRAAPRHTRKERIRVVRLCQEILLTQPRPDPAALEAALAVIGHPLATGGCRLMIDQAPEGGASALRERLLESAGAALANAVGADARLAEFVRFAQGAESVSIVGNGPSLKGAGRGAEVDASDIVVRCNFPPIDGFGKDVGTRTDAVVSFLNPASDLFEGYFTNSARYADSWFLQMSSNFKRDYGPTAPSVLERWNLRNHARVPLDAIRLIEDMAYREPTTGFHAIMFFTVFLRKKVRLFGFDFFKGTGHHYWRSGDPRPPGVHNPNFERLYVQKCLMPLFSLET
jgi:hypothetical protein